MLKKCGTARQATDASKMGRMRFARWITKATDVQLRYLILTNFPQQQQLHERVSVLRHTHISCVFFTSFLYIFGRPFVTLR
jgi:hypothetical protein